VSTYLRDKCVTEFGGHHVQALPSTHFDLNSRSFFTHYTAVCVKCGTPLEEIQKQAPVRSRGKKKPKPQGLTVEE
jgi:hypothetical protein